MHCTLHRQYLVFECIFSKGLYHTCSTWTSNTGPLNCRSRIRIKYWRIREVLHTSDAFKKCSVVCFWHVWSIVCSWCVSLSYGDQYLSVLSDSLGGLLQEHFQFCHHLCLGKFEDAGVDPCGMVRWSVWRIISTRKSNGFLAGNWTSSISFLKSDLIVLTVQSGKYIDASCHREIDRRRM